MAHIPRIVPPRCSSESSWLRAGRVWVGTRPPQVVYAAAEVVCRTRRWVVVLVCMIRVPLLWGVLCYTTVNSVYIRTKSYDSPDFNICLQPLAQSILRFRMLKRQIGAEQKRWRNCSALDCVRFCFFDYISEKGPFFNLQTSINSIRNTLILSK